MPSKRPRRTSPKPSSTLASNRSGAKHPNKWPSISIVGPGRLGSSLCIALHNAGYSIDEIVTRNPVKARRLAQTVGTRIVALKNAALNSDIIWLTVGDSAIRSVAQALAAARGDWTGKIALHSSGALASDELAILKSRGASVASVHPLMTFSGGKPPSLIGVSFAIEGDAHAARAAEVIVRALNATPIRIKPEHKPAYHAWASFGSPLLIALLATAERVGTLAGLSSRQSRPALLPLLRQTLDNYAALGADKAFTGPLVRGDVETVGKHLEALDNDARREDAAIRNVYLALAQAAIKYLPVENRKALVDLLKLPPRNRR